MYFDTSTIITFNSESHCTHILAKVVFHLTRVLPCVGLFDIFNLDFGEVFGGFHEYTSFVF